jgi:hypothetical protein
MHARSMTAETGVAHDGRRAHVFETLARMLVAGAHVGGVSS